MDPIIEEVDDQVKDTPPDTVPMIEEAKEADWSDEEETSDKKHKPRARGRGHSHSRSHTQADVDPLVAIMMNKEIIKVCSTLIAKLELIRFDDERKTVFKTPWAQGLFHSCLKRLAPEALMDFNIQQWYNDIISKNQKATASGRARATDYRFSPALTTQAVNTNWLMPLFEQEMIAPGFMTLLHNHLELEDQTHQKMAIGAKEESEYSSWINAGSLNRPIPLAITGSSSTTTQHMLLKNI
jgi:hypothetical protein